MQMTPLVLKPFFRPYRRLATSCLVLALVVAGSSLRPPLSAQVSGCEWETVARMPIAIYDAAGAVDPDSRSVYVHGGIDRDGVVRDDLYRIDLGSYAVERVRTSGANSTRWGHSFSFGRIAGKPGYLLLGGNTTEEEGFPAEKRAYSFDPGEGRWAIQNISGGLPEIQDHASAVDPETQTIILHGGRASNGRAGLSEPQTETYVIDMASGEMRRGQRDGPKRYSHSIVYDPEGHRLIMFGGTWDGRRGTDELYQMRLDGGSPENAVWAPMEASGSPPERRFNHGAAFDVARKAMIVYGGLKVEGESLNDTWALDLSTPGLAVWQDLELLNQKRSGMLLAYDPINQETLQISGGRPLSPESSKDVFRLRCSPAPDPDPTDDPSLPPVIGPTQAATATSTAIATSLPPPSTPGPGTPVPPTATLGPGTSVPPPSTQPATPGAGTDVPPAPTVAPGQPTATADPGLPDPPTEPPATREPLPPETLAWLFLPALAKTYPDVPPPTSQPPTTTAPTAGPPATQEPGPPATSAPPVATQPSCISAEREPNDKLLSSLDHPPVCRDADFTGRLVEGDSGDYLLVQLTTAGTFEAQLRNIPAGKDYDLLIYNFSGNVLGSSQMPSNLDESLSLDLEAGDYAIRIYPGTGRSEEPYTFRWNLLP